jgi:transcriptional regulator with XRE-family HTH domain
MMLKTLYQRLTADERKTLAEAAGTTPVYLYQLATDRRRPSRLLMTRLCQADKRLKLKDLAVEFSA